MARVYRNSAEVLAERAMSQEKSRVAPKGPDAASRPPERRMIYGGTMPPPPPRDAQAATTSPPTNRRIAQRKVTPFNVILILMGIAAAIVLYIGNIIAVNQLVNDIHKSEVQLQDILNEQEFLRARINQVSSLERIRKRAEEDLGLKDPSDVPGWLNVDEEKIRTIEASTSGH